MSVGFIFHRDGVFTMTVINNHDTTCYGNHGYESWKTLWKPSQCSKFHHGDANLNLVDRKIDGITDYQPVIEKMVKNRGLPFGNVLKILSR